MSDASQPGAALASMLVPPPNVVGLQEIADHVFAVDKMTAHKYTQRADFPEPTRLACGPVWSRRDVEAWKKKKWPLPVGRPRKHPTKGKRQP